MHQGGSFIYDNEQLNKDFIDLILNDEQHLSAIKAIMRNSILEDIENGTITSLEYNIEMYDYGYKIEDYCLEQFYKDKTKTLWLCPNCASDNVDIKHWVNANTREIGTDCEEETGYCNDCETHGEIFHQEMPYLKQVIGFQVLGYDGVGNELMHDKMDGRSCVYNLSQAREMLNDENNEEWCNWKLQTIWSGDIENPVIMFGFENKPRD
jgi:Zn finger protein HypA/HybF involved in hydrogenase expression